jgi:hypothetical protein
VLAQRHPFSFDLVGSCSCPLTPASGGVRPPGRGSDLHYVRR